MKPSELCYWMQGRFELEDEGNPWTTFTAIQVTTLKKHLKLVFAYIKTNPRSADASLGLAFCQYLEGVLDTVNDGKTVGVCTVSMIRKRLNEQFKHDIDPTYPNQKELNQIHNGNDDSKQPSSVDGQVANTLTGALEQTLLMWFEANPEHGESLKETPEATEPVSRPNRFEEKFMGEKYSITLPENAWDNNPHNEEICALLVKTIQLFCEANILCPDFGGTICIDGYPHAIVREAVRAMESDGWKIDYWSFDFLEDSDYDVGQASLYVVRHVSQSPSQSCDD